MGTAMTDHAPDADPAYVASEDRKRVLLELISVASTLDRIADRRRADDEQLGQQYVSRIYQLAAQLTELDQQARAAAN